MNILELNQVVKTYENHTAVDGVSFNVPKGRIFGLLGPNGAGKSTLLSALAGLLDVDSGDASLDGVSLGDMPPKERAQAIGYLPGLRVHLPGRGASVERLQDKITRLDLNDVVSLDGWLSDDDLAQLLADSDVGVVAQVANPYSHLVHTTKMFDFMEAAVPVIATRLRATEALFPTEITYVESEDSSALAEAFIDLAKDPERRERQAADAMARLQTLGWRTQMDAMTAAIGPATR